ncbi:hypothetical protein WMY93_011402 [Mugilogobius chulae]|uniref:Uncharacterized protein n=1 Tax=Mugilogobius chulae TaxID=88201 RepID=A0AAW0P5T4_9GOBI
MEEAYAQLYQEFVCLRSLCLRQASLLRKLTSALQQKQAETNGDSSEDINGDTNEDINGELNGVLGDLSSITQLDSEYPAYLSSSRSLLPPSLPSLSLPAPVVTPATSCDLQDSPQNTRSVSEVLAQDMFKLSVDTSVQRRDPSPESSVPQSPSSVMSHGGSYNKHLHQNTNHTHRNICPAQNQMPVPGCLNPGYTHALPSGGSMMMSDVALQSHVCEFCQAVFPGDTTTRGQYLQHLYTHIT